MSDTDLIPAKDARGRDILVYAKGKAPKTKPRAATRALTGVPAAPIAEKPTSKPKE